jgi:hypothetical protein
VQLDSGAGASVRSAGGMRGEDLRTLQSEIRPFPDLTERERTSADATA